MSFAISDFCKIKLFLSNIKEIRSSVKMSRKAFEQIVGPSINDVEKYKDIVSLSLFTLMKSSQGFSLIEKDLKGRIQRILELENFDPQLRAQVLKAEKTLALMKSNRTKVALEILKNTCALSQELEKARIIAETPIIWD